MKLLIPKVPARMKPLSGFAHFAHLTLLTLLPGLLYILVRVDFSQLGFALIVLSKWRMFAVRPRHWPANIRANAADIMVGISLLVFMINSSTRVWQFVWALAYGVWLLVIKRASNVFMVSVQALIAQSLALMALFLGLGDAPIVVLVGLTWVICYVAARHFFFSFEEAYTKLLSYTWGYFGAALVWILAHWLLFYGVVAQPTLLLSVLGFGLAALYYLEKTDRLSNLLRRQFVFVVVAIVTIVIAFSDWGDKAI